MTDTLLEQGPLDLGPFESGQREAGQPMSEADFQAIMQRGDSDMRLHDITMAWRFVFSEDGGHLGPAYVNLLRETFDSSVSPRDLNNLYQQAFDDYQQDPGALSTKIKNVQDALSRREAAAAPAVRIIGSEDYPNIDEEAKQGTNRLEGLIAKASQFFILGREAAQHKSLETPFFPVVGPPTPLTPGEGAVTSFANSLDTGFSTRARRIFGLEGGPSAPQAAAKLIAYNKSLAATAAQEPVASESVAEEAPDNTSVKPSLDDHLASTPITLTQRNVGTTIYLGLGREG